MKFEKTKISFLMCLGDDSSKASACNFDFCDDIPAKTSRFA